MTIEKLALITAEAIGDAKKELREEIHQEIENLALATAREFSDIRLSLQKNEQDIRDLSVRVAGIEEEIKLLRRDMNAGFEMMREEFRKVHEALQNHNLRLSWLENKPG